MNKDRLVGFLCGVAVSLWYAALCLVMLNMGVRDYIYNFVYAFMMWLSMGCPL